MGGIGLQDQELLPHSTGEKIMTQNRNGFSRLAKGLLVGSVLGVAAVFLVAYRSVAGIRRDISGEGVRFQLWGRPPSATSIEERVETGKRLAPTIGWLAIFILSSAVAVISDLRLKKPH